MFRAPQGPCGNLMCGLKLQANLQMGGDNRLQEQSRLALTNELRWFVEMDKHEAVKIGDLETRRRSKWSSPSSTRRSTRTLPSRLRSFINNANVGASRCGPLVDDDWHAICQAIYRSVEGYHKYVKMNKEVNVRNPTDRSRASMLGKVRDAREMRRGP